MTQEEKELLLADLCARLPYSVKVYGNYSYSDGEKIVDDKRVEVLDLSKLDWFINGIEIKPYLRPMSSMTEEEREEFRNFGGVMSYSPQHDTWSISALAPEAYDWLNKNMFDYRGLIPMGLALEATKNMYSI